MIKLLINESETDMETLAENELLRLNQQLYQMECDRKAYFEESNRKLVKQRALLNTLRSEKSRLITDLQVATCKKIKKRDNQTSTKLNNLLTKYEHYKEQVDQARRDLHELDTQVRKLEKRLLKMKNKDIPESEYITRVQSGKRSIQMLEDRLDTHIKRFCSVLAENKQLREEIDHLLIERANFNKVWEDLLDELSKNKRAMLDLMEQAAGAYDQREDYCSKLEALKTRTQQDISVHNQEMKEIQRNLNNFSKLKDFLTIKGQRRIMKDLEEKNTLKRLKEEEDIAKQIKIYQETLKEIKKLCNEENLNKIAAQFVKQEEENFALFNYVNELNEELESFRESLEEIDLKIGEQQEVCRANAEKQKETLDMLIVEKEKSNDNVQKEKETMEKSKRLLNDILRGIYDIFIMIGCDRAPLLDLIGEEADLSDNNIDVYLGLLKRKITDAVTAVYFKEHSLQDL